MPIYLYIPFTGADANKDRVLRNIVDDLRSSGLDFTFIEFGHQCLTAVGNDDLLMLGAHGLYNQDRIFVGDRNRNLIVSQILSASNVAEQLELHGLSKKHGAILLMTCAGGGKSQLKAAGADGVVGASGLTVTADPKKVFAARLAKAMGLRGYHSLVVGGWPGDVIASNDNVDGRTSFEAEKPDDDDEGSSISVVAQLDHIQWFDHFGRDTAQAARTARPD